MAQLAQNKFQRAQKSTQHGLNVGIPQMQRLFSGAKKTHTHNGCGLGCMGNLIYEHDKIMCCCSLCVTGFLWVGWYLICTERFKVGPCCDQNQYAQPKLSLVLAAYGLYVYDGPTLGCWADVGDVVALLCLLGRNLTAELVLRLFQNVAKLNAGNRFQSMHPSLVPLQECRGQRFQCQWDTHHFSIFFLWCARHVTTWVLPCKYSKDVLWRE